MWSVIDVDGMVGGDECFRSQPDGGSARARFVWDLAYRRGARTLGCSQREPNSLTLERR